MKKKLLATFMLLTAIACLRAALPLGDRDALYYEAHDLYGQRKYAEAQERFENYLNLADPEQRGMRMDADFYIGATAYILKQERASQLLESHIANYPNSPYISRANYMLGRMRYENKKYKYALQYYQNVNEKELDQKECREYRFTKAYSLLEMKRYDESSAIFRQLANERNEYSQTALYYYSYTEYVQKHNDEALKGFLQLEESEDYADLVPYYIVQIYYDQGNYAAALEHGSKALERNPDNPNNTEIYRIMGECAYRESKYGDAVRYMTTHEKLSKKLQRNSNYILGVSHYKNNNSKSATTYLSRVTNTTDSLAQSAYLYLGHCYLKLNDKKQAKMAFEAASNMDYSAAAKEEALYNYALASYETAAAFGESLSAMERFIEAYPNSKYIDNIYDHVVAIFLSNKNFTSAYNSITKMKSLTPRMREVKEYVLFQLGTQAFAKADYKNAIKMFSASIEESSAKSFSPQAYLWRGEAYYRLGKNKDARTDYQTYLEKPQVKGEQSVADAYYGIGYTYFSEKNYSEAANWFGKFLNKSSMSNNQTAYLDALNRMGDCYFYVRNFTSARKYYTQVIDKNDIGADYALFQNAFIYGLQKQYTHKITALEKLLTTMPNSEYRSNALYEIGRSYVMLESNKKAIETYKQVVATYPKSELARKASLEIGMLHFNMGEYDSAKAAYKEVISRYKGSEEARTAFESLESLYVETNDVPSFLDYCKKLGKDYVASIPDSKGDSLSFLAAERIYAKGNYAEATTTLRKYLQQYCTSGASANCISARYYLADSYYQQGKFNEALGEFAQLTSLEGNKYMEQSLIRAAEITYNQKDYQSSLKYFKQLQDAASSVEKRNMARLGVLRCSKVLNEYQTTIYIATLILKGNPTDEALEREARYGRAKAYIALEKLSYAKDDLLWLKKNLLQEEGAEAKYLYAEYLYSQGDLKNAEEEVFDFINNNTPHQFWLARAFVLLSDIYVAQGDDFQAKQYLLSLRDNYTEADEIQTLINERLTQIAEREKALLEE